jgi:exosortase/archaeosortase family protein
MNPLQNDIASPLTAVSSGSAPAWLRFALLCTLFLLASVWLEPHLAPLCRATATQVGLLLSLAGFTPQVQGDLVALPGFTVRIVTECTPLYACLLFGSFVLAQPATWGRTLAGLLAGVLTITVANLLRISFVTAAGTVLAPILFDILHVYLGQVAMLVLVVSAALAWLRWSAAGPAPLPFMLRAGAVATLLFVPWLLVNRRYVELLDNLVALLFSFLYPNHQLLTPRPLAIYNHTFAVPLLLALVVAGWRPWTARRLGALLGGVCLLAGWHALFRVSHVFWTALNMSEIEPLHQAIYLLGQFLLPFLLWLRLDGRSFRQQQPVSPLPVQTSIIALLLTLCSSVSAVAEPLVLIHPTGRGGFVIKADNLNRVTEAEIRVDYQSESETPPQVQGAGLGAQATIAVQNDTPGSITLRLKSSKPMSGHVMLATAQIRGSITFLTAWLRNEQGMTETPQISIRNPSDDELKALNAKPSPVPSRSNVSESGTLAAPATLPQDISSTKTVSGDASVSTAAQDTEYEMRPVAFSRRPGVLELFRTSPEKRSVETLAVLLRRDDVMFSQEPPLLLSDGTAAVRLTVRSADRSNRAPQFNISGGNCIGLIAGDDGVWVLEIVPESGSLHASVTVLTGKEMIEYPLTVAPPLDLFDEGRAGAGEAEFVAAANKLVKGNHIP